MTLMYGLQPEETLLIAGRTVNMADTPRSYIVQTPSSEIQRNRSQLNIDPSIETETAEDTQEQQTRSPIMTRSRTVGGVGI